MEFPLSKFEKWFEQHEKSIQSDFFQFLSFRSISTDPDSHPECLKAASFLVSRLQGIGLEAELLKSPGLPVVFAQSAKENERSILFYHHYDVQPEDPIELWEWDPFTPRFQDGKVFARGASDNKGQCFITLTVLEALKELLGSSPLNIKLFIEGEEESEGIGTAAVIAERGDLLKSDALCVVDFDLPGAAIPGITMGYRGIVALDIECTNSATDLHSGMHGGVALNPIRILTESLASFFDERGKVAVPHFYDGVEDLTEEEKQAFDFCFDEAQYRKEFGVGALYKEEGYSVQESGCIRPTLEVNGIWGGYTGTGFKTVIPSSAYAKVSCRLVGKQDPVAIQKHLRDFLEKSMPEGASLKLTFHAGAHPFRSSLDSPLTTIITNSMEEVFKQPCRYTLCGGSVPIIHDLAKAVGGDVALFGFALATDNIHAPNEHFKWDCFKKGFLVISKILWDLSYART